MKKEVIVRLHASFEEQVHKEQDGSEYWLARDLQELLGYAKWENFARVIEKASTACKGSGYDPQDHFLDVRKMVELGSGATRAVDDIALTRYACYLIAQNGDPSKEAIAFAQTYFAVQTRKQELIEQRLPTLRTPTAATAGFGYGPDFLAFGFDQNGCGFAEYDGTLGERVWYWLAATSRLQQKGRIGLDGLGRLQRAAGGPKPNVRCCVALIRTG